MAEEPHTFVMYYRHCDTTWVDTWSCACDSECPVCGHDIEPYEYENVAESNA